MARAIVNALVRGLPVTVPFVGPEAQERARGRPFRARLGANESGFGPSPAAIAAMCAAAPENWKYSDPENHDLRAALARFHAVEPGNIVVGEGIDGLLALTVRLSIEPGGSVVTSSGAYPTFSAHAVSHGGKLIRVPYLNDREDLDALLDAAIREHAHILYVSNPDNPMGSWWNAKDLERFIEALPGDTLLCLDEAYCDTAPADALPGIDVSNPQVLRYRTFSKAYGLAGARIGYCIGEATLIREFEKVRNHYGINRIGQTGALAALDDQAYLKDVVEKIAQARSRISRIALANGLHPLASGTNFVAIDCQRDGAFARRVLDGLLERDIFARMPAVAPLDRCIRISAGSDGELDILAQALPDALAAANQSISERKKPLLE